MNKVIISGRLTSDPEMRTAGQTLVARFNVAVQRRFKNADGNYDADFIPCVAFGKQAEFVEKYFTKGMKTDIIGRLQSGRYTNKDGKTSFTLDLIIEEMEFAESKRSAGGNNLSSGRNTKAAETSELNDGFMAIPDGVDDEGLPFS